MLPIACKFKRSNWVDGLQITNGSSCLINVVSRMAIRVRFQTLHNWLPKFTQLLTYFINGNNVCTFWLRRKTDKNTWCLLGRASFDNCRIKHQLDATYFIIFLIASTCFGHYFAHHQKLAAGLQPGHYSSLPAPNLQPTANQERNDQCGNQHHSRELLMMDIVVLETCWAYK